MNSCAFTFLEQCSDVQYKDSSESDPILFGVYETNFSFVQGSRSYDLFLSHCTVCLFVCVCCLPGSSINVSEGEEGKMKQELE